MSPEAATYLRKAERPVEEAQLLLQAQKTEGACNRAYYAMFDAAQAALLAVGHAADGASAKTHRGLIAAFGRFLVQTGRLDAALGRALQSRARGTPAGRLYGRAPSPRRCRMDSRTG